MCQVFDWKQYNKRTNWVQNKFQIFLFISKFFTLAEKCVTLFVIKRLMTRHLNQHNYPTKHKNIYIHSVVWYKSPSESVDGDENFSCYDEWHQNIVNKKLQTFMKMILVTILFFYIQFYFNNEWLSLLRRLLVL